MSAVYCPPKGQCILSGILPPPSCYLNTNCGGKKSPLQGGKGLSFADLKKEPVYIAKACTVLSVYQSCQGVSLRWPGLKSCFQQAPRGGAESDFANPFRRPKDEIDKLCAFRLIGE
jgi:hypothetical protein